MGPLHQSESIGGELQFKKSERTRLTTSQRVIPFPNHSAVPPMFLYLTHWFLAEKLCHDNVLKNRTVARGMSNSRCFWIVERDSIRQ